MTEMLSVSEVTTMTDLNNPAHLTNTGREARRRLAIVFSKGSTVAARQASYALFQSLADRPPNQ